MSSCGAEVVGTTTDQADDEAEIMHKSVRSLYFDGIKPRDSDLLRRLQQFKASRRLQENFIEEYSKRPDLYIVQEERTKSKRVFCVLLKDPPMEGPVHWIDPKDPADPYEKTMWAKFVHYVSSLMQESNCQTVRPECPSLYMHQFKGGRYGMALELRQACDTDEKLHFLREYNLGQLCHVVQLAISKKILAYENNILQPIAACQDIGRALLTSLSLNHEQDCYAEDCCTAPWKSPPSCSQKDSRGDPTTRSSMSTQSGRSSFSSICEDFPCGDGNSTMAHSPASAAELEVVKERLRLLLDDYPRGLLLSQLKKKLAERYKDSLSPMSFGFTKMNSFLNSSAFSDVCRVYIDSKSHVIVQSCSFRRPKHVKPLIPDKEETYSQLDADVFTPARSFNDISFENWRHMCSASPVCSTPATFREGSWKNDSELSWKQSQSPVSTCPTPSYNPQSPPCSTPPGFAQLPSTPKTTRNSPCAGSTGSPCSPKPNQRQRFDLSQSTSSTGTPFKKRYPAPPVRSGSADQDVASIVSPSSVAASPAAKHQSPVWRENTARMLFHPRSNPNVPRHPCYTAPQRGSPSASSKASDRQQCGSSRNKAGTTKFNEKPGFRTRVNSAGMNSTVNSPFRVSGGDDRVHSAIRMTMSERPTRRKASDTRGPPFLPPFPDLSI